MATKKTENNVETISFEVEVQGKKIKLETVADLLDAPASVAMDFEDGKTLSGFRALVGDYQWSLLEAEGITIRDLNDSILPAWQEAMGTAGK